MGNVKGFKRVLAIVLAATCMLTFSFSMAFASAESPTKGDTVSKSGNTYTVTNTSSKTVSVTKVKNAKTATVAATVAYGDSNYAVTAIGAKAFGKKTKTVKIKSTKLTKVSTKAFSKLSKAQKAKVKVKVTKKMSKANYKKLVKALTKAGIKKKNISKKL